MITRTLTTLGLLTLTAGALQAQSLASRIQRVDNGTVRLSYASRPDVCGNGTNNINFGNGNRITRGGSPDFEYDCDYGPAHLVLTVHNGAITRLRSAVGGRFRPAGPETTDLGMVGTREVSAWLLDLARRSTSRVGGEAVFALVLADSVTPWPDLLRLARDGNVPGETRKSAVFWLGQAAGDAATRDLTELAEDERGDQEVRESAIFALSQLHDDQGVPALIRIARTNRDPDLRRKALFWLGQSDDPRALDLFEELLTSN